MLNLIDEFTHECLAIRVDRKLNSADVIDVLSDLFILRGVPQHIRSDNGPEFVAKTVQDWIGAVGAKTAYIERGSPWGNGFIESFDARLRDECSTAKSSTRLLRRGSSSRAGGATTTPSDPMDHWATNRRPRRSSFRRIAARAASQPRPAAPPALAQSPSMY